MTELPTPGRNAQGLVLLLPGMHTSSNSISATVATNGTTLSANGVRDQASQFTVDGADVNISMYNYNEDFTPVPEAVEEMTVQTGILSAEYGKYAGGHVNYVMKSGTNGFHGAAFEFTQNDAMNARNFFSPTVPLQRLNQFGGVLGGPIRKNKTFFFLDYQALRNHRTTFYQNIVPTEAQRNGDLSLNTSGAPAGNYAPRLCAQSSCGRALCC